MKLRLLLSLVLFAAMASAQMTVDHWGVKFVNFTYANSASDTSLSQNVAGAGKLALVLTSKDSAQWDVYVQYKDSGATWTTRFTDSLKTTVNTGKMQEYHLIGTGLDVFDAFVYPVRVIIAARASGNGVTSPTFTGQWYVRP